MSAEYVDARNQLKDEDFGQSGTPKLAALNAVLLEMGHEKITAEDRDAFEALMADGDEPETITLTITDGPCNPVPLYVHGVGHFRIQHNRKTTLPREALDALHHVGGITIQMEGIIP